MHAKQRNKAREKLLEDPDRQGEFQGRNDGGGDDEGDDDVSVCLIHSRARSDEADGVRVQGD